MPDRIIPTAACEMLEPRRHMAAGQLDPTFAGSGLITLPPESSVEVKGNYVFYLVNADTSQALLRRPLTGSGPQALIDYRPPSVGSTHVSIGGFSVRDDGSVLVSRYASSGGGGGTSWSLRGPDGKQLPYDMGFGSYDTIGGISRFSGPVQTSDGSYYGLFQDREAFDEVTPPSWFLFRKKPDGTFDTFDGRSETQHGIPVLRVDYLREMGIFPGRLLAWGKRLFLVERREGDSRLIALKPDGSIDTSFSEDGMLQIESVSEQVDRDGRLLVVAKEADVHRLVRLMQDGTKDPRFVESTRASAFQVYLQPDGRIVRRVGNIVTRLRSDGAPDESYRPFDLASLSNEYVGLQPPGNRSGDMIVHYQRTIDGTQQTIVQAIDSGLPDVPGEGLVRLPGGDFNGDGREDVFVYDPSTGQTSVTLMRGADRLAEVSLNTVQNRDWMPRAIADLDDDTDPDVVWQNPKTGQNLLWIMSGLSRQSTPLIRSNADPRWQVVAAEHLDLDDRADLLFRHPENKVVYAWYNRAQGGAWDAPGSWPIATHVAAAPTGWQIAGTQHDGNVPLPHLLWQHAQTGVVVRWRYVGSALAASETLAKPGASWKLYGVADVDADGDDDLLWRHETNGTQFVWLARSGGYDLATPDVL